MDKKSFLLIRFPNDVTRNAALAILKREMPRVPYEDISEAVDILIQEIRAAKPERTD